MKSIVMRSMALRSILAGMVIVGMTLLFAVDASAQCATCPAPTVAYRPVVAQPTVAYKPYTGWYPGKWVDQWRLRRAGVGTTAPAYTAAYAPTYTAAYAPTYTAAYASPNNYTAAYRPYVTAYAPLSSPIVQTAYYPVTQTVARQVLMRPVAVAPACNTCNFTPSCGCDVSSTGVSQAAYSEPGCSSCAGGSSVGNVLPPSNSGLPNVGPQTPQPSFSPEPAPANSPYGANRPVEGHDSHNVEPPADEVDPLKEHDPGPAKTEVDPSTYYNAPRLLDPRDRTAARSYKQSHKPTVEVWTAVYRGPAKHRNISNTNSQPQRSQAEIDADGWTAVPRSR
ncbi:MAG: hypothetical protein GXP24_11560 [Planctomycetes bacterium]|nr:hypothetical protein [Planctomycetota bacterium]